LEILRYNTKVYQILWDSIQFYEQKIEFFFESQNWTIVTPFGKDTVVSFILAEPLQRKIPQSLRIFRIKQFVSNAITLNYYD